jgi:trimeric autotransporter adhesin
MLKSFLRTLRCTASLAVIMLAVSTANAQVNSGAVRGEVKDGSGGLVRGAQVTLTNQETGVSRTDVTNDSGVYLFPIVDPGTYTVTIITPGFEKFSTTGNIVTLGKTQTVDATLQVGKESQTVEVVAGTLTLDTASAEAGQLYSEQQVQNLPSLGRNPFMFATYDSDVVTLGDPRYVRAEDSSGSTEVSLAGAPSGTNSYNVDGIPVSTSSGGETFVVSPEAVSDAKVQADTFDAEVGRTGGGIFNTSFKSGTDQYHGVLYGETRQTPWAANTWFNYPSSAFPNGAPTPNDDTYLYSGAFGGPVPFTNKVPWLKNTFFWATEEGYRQGQPNTGTSTYYVPTAAERTGDFSAYAPANGSLTSCTGTTGVGGGSCAIIYDPTTFPRMSYLQENGVNKIPSSAINPIGSWVASAWPAQTENYIYGQNGDVNYYIPSMSFKSRSDEYVGKLEHVFSPWWTGNVSFLHDAVQEPDITFLLTPLSANNTKLIRYFDATSAGSTFTINPTTVLTVGYGFNRYYSASPPYSTPFNSSTGFGGTGFPSSLTSYMASKTFPSFTLSDLTNSAALGGSYGGPTIQASHNWVAILTKTIMSHTIKFGYVYRGFGYFTNPATGSAGAYTFTGQNTNSSGTPASSDGVTAIADLLVGEPASATMQINDGPYVNKETYNALFVQDDYRITPKLTVNLGLRYEYELGQFASGNKFNIGFDPSITSTYAGISGNPVSLTGGLEFAGVNGAPVHCCDNPHAKFSPRIGVSYQVMNNTVVHAGFGLFYAPVGISPETAGYSQLTTYAPGNTTSALPVGASACLSAPFVGNNCDIGLLQPSGNTLGALTSVGSSIGSTSAAGVLDFKRQYPYVQQYLMDVERQLPYDIIVRVSYIGAHGNNFLNVVNVNQMPDSALASAAASGTILSTKITNPLYAKTVGGYPSTGILAASTYAQGQFLLPYPQFGAVGVSQSDGYSWYNALALRAEKRMTNGLTLLATYTWSANWDNLWGTASQVFYTYGAQDYYNPGAEYARSINSIPNRVTLASTYALPFGKGQKLASNLSGFGGSIANAAIGGWQMNYEQIIQNGVPLSVTQTDLSSSTYGTTSFGGAYQRPSLAPGMDVHDACVGGKPQDKLGVFFTPATARREYLNISAFAPTLPYEFGDVSRSLPCRAPGADSATASLNKSFSIHERLQMQLRFEALNIWNTPQFGYPTTTMTVCGTGVTGTPAVAAYGTQAANPNCSAAQGLGNLSTQIGFARIIQMGGRITF